MSFRADRIYLEFLRLTRRLSNQQIMMLLAVVVGVLAGLGAYLFEMLLHGIKSGLIRWFPVDSAHILFLIYPAVGIILATLFVKYIVRDNISEGVTRVLYAMSRRNSRIARHNCWTSIVGGATTIGFGGSVGPEAPIVLTGAAIGSNIGRLARLNYKHTTLLLCCGAGAALAAIFKAPITGVVFVLEILMLDITAGSVIPLLIASITATTMAFMLRGFDPILAVTLAPEDAFELWQIPLFILLGVLCDAHTLLDPTVLKLLVLGILALLISGIGGILGGYLMYFFKRGNFNPVIGIAAVSCVPTTAKVAQKIVAHDNPSSMILPDALGANIMGVITSAIIAAIYVTVVPML